VCGSFWRVDKIQKSEFNIFCTLVTMATVTILNLFTPAPQQLPHTAVDIPTKFQPKKSQSVGQTLPQLPWK
jgi:hypothetical protein